MKVMLCVRDICLHNILLLEHIIHLQDLQKDNEE